jgi:sensitive to high expression protein 9
LLVSESTITPAQTTRAYPRSARRSRIKVGELQLQSGSASNQHSEQLVRDRHAAIQEAKIALETAQALQATSQKEVVGLLERKHSWSATDLERYMSLIRSEHANEQAVQAAKDAVSSAELSLEEARTRLEKRERMQYHEEQVWSDTIRRNSTWVTFGLMGVNIAILLFNLVAIEPWRRRKMVKEIRSALDEKTGASSPEFITVASSGSTADAEALEALEPAIETSQIPVEGLQPETITAKGSTETDGMGLASVPSSAEQFQPLNGARLQSYLAEFFSDQLIIIRKVEITTVALQAAAAGAAVAAGAMILILRPR